MYDDYTNGNAAALFGGLTTNIANTIASGITVDNAGDKFFIVAYETGGTDAGAHLYWADSAAVVSDTTVTVNEVQYVAFIDGMADDGLDNNEFVMASITDDVATYG